MSNRRKNKSWKKALSAKLWLTLNKVDFYTIRAALCVGARPFSLPMLQFIQAKHHHLFRTLTRWVNQNMYYWINWLVIFPFDRN
jgi:hypothetical protein